MNLQDVAELPPWLRYLLVGIIERHLLHDEFRLILQTQLPSDAPDSGDVPGRPGWVYNNGWSCWFVANDELGVSLMVEQKAAPELDEITVLGLGLQQHPLDEPSTDSVEATAFWRAMDWLPGPGVISHAIDDLRAMEALVERSDRKVQLHRTLAEDVDRISSLADNEALIAKLFPEGDEEEYWDAWYEWLLEISADPTYRALISTADELESDEVERQVWEFLQKPPGEETLIALEVAAKHDLDVPPAVVETLLRKLDPLGADEYGNTVRALARYALPRDIATPLVVDKLLEYASGARARKYDLAEGMDEELGEMLKMAGADTMSGGVDGLEQIATLLLEHSPEHALPVIRRALREDDTGVLLMAGRLIAIGQPWAIREVVAATPEVSNPLFRQNIALLLRSRGFHDAAEKAEELAGGVGGSPFGMFGDEMEQGMMEIMKSVAASPEISAKLDEWAEGVRAKLPDGFGEES